MEMLPTNSFNKW